MSSSEPDSAHILLPSQFRPLLDLLSKALTNYLYLGGRQKFWEYGTTNPLSYRNSEWKIGKEAIPHTLLHKEQLNNLEACIYSVVREGVPGDIIEAGVFRGGAVIYIRAVLMILGVTDRKVWLADTFSGIPMPEKYPDVPDSVNDWTDRWSAGINEVRQTIARYGMLDEKIKFIEGPFAATLQSPPYGDIAIARLDADSYESTRDAIELIYPHIQPGGFIIIDDWKLPACKQAVVEYREKHNIKDPIRVIFIPEAEAETGARVPLEAFWQVGSYTESS